MRATRFIWSALALTWVAVLLLTHTGAAAEDHIAQIAVTDCTVAAELEIAKDTVIDGDNLVTISGGDTTRVFHNAALVTVRQPPSLVTQPLSQTIISGQSVTLTVSATGTLPLSYQWYIGSSGNTSTPIGGATASSYTTSALESTTRFWVQVSNSAGSMNSNTATVEVKHNVYFPMISYGSR